MLRTAVTAFDKGEITAEELEWFTNQARVLRGFYHFEAWRMWANRTTNTGVPYVAEDTDQSTLTNTEDIRSLIIADLQAGTQLPNDMGQIGRFNKTVAQVF